MKSCQWRSAHVLFMTNVAASLFLNCRTHPTSGSVNWNVESVQIVCDSARGARFGSSVCVDAERAEDFAEWGGLAFAWVFEARPVSQTHWR
jgi:hypothetical protein